MGWGEIIPTFSFQDRSGELHRHSSRLRGKILFFEISLPKAGEIKRGLWVLENNLHFLPSPRVTGTLNNMWRLSGSQRTWRGDSGRSRKGLTTATEGLEHVADEWTSLTCGWYSRFWKHACIWEESLRMINFQSVTARRIGAFYGGNKVDLHEIKQISLSGKLDLGTHIIN